ncbi:MAG: hypothetical protein GTO02_03490 [Candidatus Dadabacteria bacterium]|nr:hypothetical protein [Candidatus Dadabacteria bacterium]
MYYVQVRRGGFQNPGPWGEKGHPFDNVKSANTHIKGVQEMADKYDCVIDYIITDESGQVIERG